MDIFINVINCSKPATQYFESGMNHDCYLAFSFPLITEFLLFKRK